jgi:hypothetical protein
MGRKGMNLRAIYALERGWIVIPHPLGRDRAPDQYEHGPYRVWWASGGGLEFWQTARKVEGRVKNHEPRRTFREALARFDGNGGV